MINKLDPRQYNPYALNTPSGNLSFEEGVDFFNCHLLENLTGDFNIFGSLQVNSGTVIFTDSSNTVESNNNSIVNSVNSSVSGSNNTLINSNESSLGGNYNTIIGGQGNEISNCDYCSILFGSNTINQNTGSAIIADGEVTRLKQSVRDNSLTVDFSSGTFIKNDLFVDGAVHLTGSNGVEIQNGDFSLKGTSSGSFEGDISIGGTAYLSGSPLQNLENLTGASGQLNHDITGASGSLTTTIQSTETSLDLKVRQTGSAVINYTNNLSGILSDEFYVDKLILDTGRTIPTNFASAGISGELSFDHQYFYICTGDNAWARIQFTAWGLS